MRCSPPAPRSGISRTAAPAAGPAIEPAQEIHPHLRGARDKLPTELAAEVLRGGLDTGRAAHCHVAGGHSIDDPEPKYGMAVTGAADPDALLRIDAGGRVACSRSA